jgi:hypothetical protein
MDTTRIQPEYYETDVDGMGAYSGVHTTEGWHRVVVDLADYAGQTIQVRFSFHTDSYSYDDGGGWYIDDVLVTEGALIPVVIETPSDLGAAGVGQPVERSLAASGSGSYVWSIEDGTNHGWLSMDPATGTLSGTPLAANIGPVTVTVRAADETNLSNYDEKVFELSVIDALLYEDFTTWPPAGWTIVDGGSTTDTWMHCDGCGNTLDGADGAYAMVDSDGAGSGSISLVEELITPSIDCSGKTSVFLEFYHYYKHIGSGEGRVEVSVDGGASWNQIVSYTSDTVNGALESFDISTHAAGQADVKIRFLYDDGAEWAWYWLVDDVTLFSM